jgi:hypothetical protein
MRTLLIAVAVVVLLTPAALAEEKKTELPPGWNVKWCGTLLCPRCVGMGYNEAVGRCGVCGKGTASGNFRICPKHALEKEQCTRCLTPFPPRPTPGLELKISWVRPDRGVKNPHVNVDNVGSVPLWVSLVNTTKKDVMATELSARGPNPSRCTSLIFIVTAKGKTVGKVLWNVSPFLNLRRALANVRLTLKPGASTFGTDLAKLYSATGKLKPGRYTVVAAAGRLKSNALTVQIAAGAGMAIDPKDPKAQKTLADLRTMWKMCLKRGQYAKALEVARRIAAINPDVGRKMVMMSEVYMKKQAVRNDTTRGEIEAKKRAIEEMKQREKMLRDEELKRRREE